MSYTHLREGDPSIETFRHTFLKIRRALVAGPEGMRFIAVGAKPQPAYDGRETL